MGTPGRVLTSGLHHLLALWPQASGLTPLDSRSLSLKSADATTYIMGPPGSSQELMKESAEHGAWHATGSRDFGTAASKGPSVLAGAPRALGWLPWPWQDRSWLPCGFPLQPQGCWFSCAAWISRQWTGSSPGGVPTLVTHCPGGNWVPRGSHCWGPPGLGPGWGPPHCVHEPRSSRSLCRSTISMGETLRGLNLPLSWEQAASLHRLDPGPMLLI